MMLFLWYIQGGAGFLEAAAAELPTKTVEEIEQHEQWYIEYCTLLASKKKAIEEWKEEKQVRQTELSIEMHWIML